MPESVVAPVNALIIDTPLVWTLMCALDPHFNELSYEENFGSYLVLNLEGVRWSIMNATTFYKYFDRIENSESIKTYHFIKK